MSFSSQQQISVLHVDDNPSITDLTETFLERDDDQFTVETATSADEGLERINDRPPDCIVSDYNMPGMDGIEFLQAVREDYPDLPFILFTGKGSEAVASDAIAADVTDYLQKGSGASQYTVLANRISNAVEATRSATKAEQRRHRLEQILKTAPGCVVQCDADGQFAFANERAEAVLGLETDELTQRAYNDPEWELRDENGEPIPDEELPFRQVRDAGEPIYNAKHTITWPDGSQKILSVNAAPLFDETGDVESVVASLNDITEQRERQRELRLLQRAIEDAADGVAIIDDEEYVYVDRSHVDMYGFDNTDQLLGNTWRKLYADDEIERLEQEAFPALEADGHWRGMVTGSRPDGSKFPAALSLTAVEDGRVICTVRDETERKDREHELESERRFIEQTLDVLDDFFYVLDTDGTLRRYNEKGPEVTGYSESELDGMPATELFPEDEHETVRKSIEATLTDGEVTVSADLLTADGQRIPYEFSGARLTDEDGNTTGLVGVGRDLTERRQREQRFQALVEESNDIISILDSDGRYQYQSPSVERILGYAPEETVGDEAWDYIHPDDRERIREEFNTWAHHTNGTSEALEYRARHADGSWRWMEAEGNDQFDNPAVEGYVINSRDITDRREREQELGLLQQAIDDADVPITLADPSQPDEPLVYVNNAFEEMTGYPPEETLGHNCRFLQGDDTDPEKTAALRDAIDNEEPISVELANYRKDGTKFRNRLTVTPIYDDDGNLVRYLGTQENVTERKEREQEILELKRQYQTLAENLPNGAVFLFNADLQYVRARGTELEAVGLSPDEIEGGTPHDIFPEETANELARYFTDALNGISHTFTQTLDGETYRNRTVPVQVSDETVTYGLALSQNITEQAEQRQNLERQNERLEEFASIVSHDLRSPLSVAEGSLELAQDTGESDHLTRAADALNRSQTLIDDLLTLAQEGDQIDELEPVALTDVAQESWQSVETAQTTLETDTLQAVKADRSRLRQLFENLYRNAVNHGGDNLTVSVGVTETGFYVMDTGRGIPESDREEVFEAGYSTSAEGTGFGLRIVEQIADAHGWAVTATESKQGGARFEITGVEFTDR